VEGGSAEAVQVDLSGLTIEQKRLLPLSLLGESVHLFGVLDKLVSFFQKVTYVFRYASRKSVDAHVDGTRMSEELGLSLALFEGTQRDPRSLIETQVGDEPNLRAALRYLLYDFAVDDELDRLDVSFALYGRLDV